MRVRKLNGYRVVYIPDHPSAMTSDNWNGFIYEHIVVAERILGRRLRKDEVCHHLDGNRENNRENNILVILRSQHTKLHNWLNGLFGSDSTGKKREVKKRHIGVSSCVVCNAPLKCQKAFCSNRCRAAKDRKVDWPTKEQLLEDIKNMSWCAIGRKYGVSDNAVRKWARKYGILKPKRIKLKVKSIEVAS